MLTAEQLEAFNRDGFLHLKNVFDPQEIQHFSNLGRARTDSDTLSVNLNLVPELSRLCFDNRLLPIAKQLLGGETSYFFESNYVRYDAEYLNNVQGHLHHDGKGTPEHLFNRIHHSFDEPYPVIRFGIYLQNTETLSGGLKICPGSHLTKTASFGDRELAYYDVPSEPGDLICFCLRVLHSPFARRQKQAPDSALAPWDENQLLIKDPDTFLPVPDNRETIFIDFAGTDVFSDLHIKSRALSPSNRKVGLANAFLTGAMESVIRNPGVRFRYDFALVDTLFEIEKHTSGGQITEASLGYIKLLMQLSATNTEFSEHFPFTQLIKENRYSLGDAAQLFNTMTQKFTKYRGHFSSKDRDEHMGVGYSPP